MLNRLLDGVLRQRMLVILGTLLLAGAGIVAWHRLPIDAFPDVTNVQVMVLTEAPGLSAPDVEQRITFPLEVALQGLPRVREVRSLSKSTLSQVVVVFDDGVDVYFARQLVFERLQSVREGLPDGAEPEMGPVSTGLGEIFQYTLESDRRGPMELRSLQDWFVAPTLRAVAGVNEVNSFGGFVRQYHVLVRPDALRKYGLTLAEVVEAVGRNNANAGGDFIRTGDEQAYIRSVGQVGGIEDLGRIVLRAKGGTPVCLSDVAELTVGHQTRQGAVTRDGRGETVAGMVIMLRGENSKTVVDRVKAALPEIRAGLPKDVKIAPFYDRTSLIEACIGTVTDALLQGGALVIAVLFLFLWNLRSALIVALSLPLAALFAFLCMDRAAVTANLMSLGGLAIAIGMVVDASIVVCENLSRHLWQRRDSGATPLEIARGAVREVARPVAFSIAIIVIVFIPLFTLEQMEGKMFRPMALTMCFAMVGALVVALTAVPVLGLSFVRDATDPEAHGIVRFLKRGYRPLLDRALRHPRVTVAVAVVLFVAALVPTARLGTTFLPPLDEGALAINVVRLPSAALEGSVAAGTFMERRLAKFPEVAAVVTKTGRAEISEDPMGPEQSDLVVMLHPRAKWPAGRTREQLVEDIRRELEQVPGIRLSFSQPIALRVNELISGIKSDVAIKIFGNELEALVGHAGRIAEVLGQTPGAQDVKVEQVTGLSQIEVRIDRAAIARHRINVADINELVETAVGGRVATTAIEGQQRIAVLVRFPERDRSDLGALGRLLVPAPDGTAVPLAQLARIVEVEGPAQISREHAMRRVVVECNVRGRDMGGFVREVRAKLAPLEAALPSGTFVRYGGQFQNQERAMRRLGVVVPLSVALIFLMLFSAFGNARHALLVIANLPLALAGGVAAIAALDLPLSVSSAVGFIALFGIAVQNGTVLVAFFNQLRARGLDAVEAVREGCDLRFRPLMMTTLTALLGLLPMTWASGPGAELQRPIAVVVLGGLVGSQALTMLVLPALYVLIERGRKPPAPEAAPT